MDWLQFLMPELGSTGVFYKLSLASFHLTLITVSMDNPFESILNKLDKMERKFDLMTKALESKFSNTEQEEPLTVGQAADFLKLKKNTIYYMTSKNLIPHLKRGKYLYFFKQDLIEWLRDSRNANSLEMKQAFLHFPVRKRKSLRVHTLQQ